jgi:hypothetical protein
MKQFQNIIEAINYHNHCYICGAKLVLDFHGETIIWEHNLFRINLSAMVDSDTDDFLTIDAITNQVQLEQRRRYPGFDPIYCIGTDTLLDIITPPKRPQTYAPILFDSLQVGCSNSKCRCFNYVFQMKIHFGLSNMIEFLTLNSENILIINEGKEHHISNNYISEKTTYISYLKGRNNRLRDFELPLVPLNLQNPNETLARLQKLITFS